MASASDKDPGSEVVASMNGKLHSIEVTSDFLILTRKFPPTKREIRYVEIASIEHRRLVNYGLLVGALTALALAFIVNTVDPVKKIIEALAREIEVATGASFGGLDVVLTVITAGLIIVTGYYLILFSMSLTQRLIIYRPGKRPIAIPMNLTGDALKVLAEINKKVKAAAGLSKDEVERLIGEQIRSLFEERNRMQDELVSLATVELKAAKTAEEKMMAKQKLAAGMEKLKAHDEEIEIQLKKTGLTKEDVFKKYRIKAPQEDFIESVLKSEGVEL